MPDQQTPHDAVAGYVLGALDPGELADFEAHLADCDACRAQVAEWEGLSRLLDDAAPPFDVPGDLRERTLAAVEDAATAPVDFRGPRARRNLRTARSMALAGVAAGVVGLVLGLSLASPEPAGATVELVSPTGGPAAGTARVRTTATGRVVDLRLHAMPASPRGTFYECWFVGANDAIEHPNRVSVGTFTVGRDGMAHVHMTASAAASRYPTMGVTLEPDDGNPARTGDKVLVTK
jgi:anti-sigma-K factor RskA